MKTMIEIDDDLLRAAHTIAVDEGTTLRALVEASLRRRIDDRGSAGFRLVDGSFGDNGLRLGFAESDWDAIRGLGYEGFGD